MTTEHRNFDDHARQQSDIAEELKDDAGHIKDTVSTRAKEEAESRKGQAVHVAETASNAIRTVADDLRDKPEVPDWMASTLNQSARKIEDLASHIDGRSIDQLGRDLSDFARRNPGTFLAASAAAGFAAARILRAGADKKRHDQGSSQAASDYAAENIRPAESGGVDPSGMGGASQ